MGGPYVSILSVWERENTQNSDRYCKQRTTKKKKKIQMQDFLPIVLTYP